MASASYWTWFGPWMRMPPTSTGVLVEWWTISMSAVCSAAARAALPISPLARPQEEEKGHPRRVVGVVLHEIAALARPRPHGVAVVDEAPPDAAFIADETLAEGPLDHRVLLGAVREDVSDEAARDMARDSRG